MKLSRFKKDNLDVRYTSYDPDQEFEDDESMIQLCCALHGPYEVPSKKLQRMYLKKTLRSAGCLGCREDGLSDYDYRHAIALRLKAHNGCKINQMLNPPHPDWHPLSHWNKPNLQKL